MPQAGPIGSNRPNPTPPTAQFNDLDIEQTRSEEILRMISIDGPHTQMDLPDSNTPVHHLSHNHSYVHNQPSMTGGPSPSSTSKPPDVIPRGAPPANSSPPSSQAGTKAVLSYLRIVDKLLCW